MARPARRRAPIDPPPIALSEVPDPQSDPDGYEEYRAALEAQTQADQEQSREEQAAQLLDIDEREGGDFFRNIEELRGQESVIWHVTRTLPVAMEGYCGEMSAAEFSLPSVKREFGPGTYKCRPMLSGRFIKGGGKMKISAPPPERQLTAQSSSDALRTFGEREEARSKAEDDRRERARRERNDLLTIIVPALAPLGAALVTGMLGRRGETDIAALAAALKPAPQPSMLEIATALKQLTPEVVPAREPPDVIDKALKLVEAFGDRLGGDTQGDSGWGVIKELLKSAAPAVGPLIGRALATAQNQMQPRAQGQLPAPPVQQVPSGAPAAVPSQPIAPGLPSMGSSVSSAAGESSPPETSDMNLGALAKLIPFFREQCESLLRFAPKGTMPELVADLFLEDAERAGLTPEIIIGFLSHPDWGKRLMQFEPKLEAYSPWLTSVRDAILAYFEQPEENAAEERKEKPEGDAGASAAAEEE